MRSPLCSGEEAAQRGVRAASGKGTSADHVGGDLAEIEVEPRVSPRIAKQLEAALDEHVVLEIGVAQGVDLERRPKETAIPDDDVAVATGAWMTIRWSLPDA